MKNYSNGTKHFRSEDIKEEIERTRDRMDHALDSIAARLDPRHVTHEVADWAREKIEHFDSDSLKDTAREIGHKTGVVVRENPIPIALGLLAIAAVFLPSPIHRRHEREEFEDELEEELDETAAEWEEKRSRIASGLRRARTKAGRAYRDATAHVAEASHHLKENLSGSTHGAGDALRSAAETSREKLHRARLKSAVAMERAKRATVENAREAGEVTKRRFEQGREEFPVAMGLGALALGFVAALCLPRTRSEDAMCGAKSDELKRKAKRAARTELEDHRLDPEGLKERTREAIDEGADYVEDQIEEHVEPH